MITCPERGARDVVVLCMMGTLVTNKLLDDSGVVQKQPRSDGVILLE